jgi:G3E family GTPase
MRTILDCVTVVTMAVQPTPLVLVAGLDRELAARVAAGLLEAPGTAVVHHDLRSLGEGVVIRTVRTRTADRISTTSTAIELAHGCVSCTLRLDLLPLLLDLADRQEVARLVLDLDPALEPEHLCWSLQNVLPDGRDRPVSDRVRVDAVLAVIDGDRWLADVTGGDDLADRGLATTSDDDRTVAQVALGQVAFADAVLLAGGTGDAWEAARLSAVLDRVVPGALRVRVETPPEDVLAAVPPGARRGRLSSAHDALLEGEPPLHEDVGVGLVRFAADRPLHPGRLHDALDVLLDGVVMSKGRIWLASQHDRVVWIESAGHGLRVADSGAWLAATPASGWADIPPERQVAASLRWDPEHGDRHTELIVLTHERPASTVTAALRSAVLTDDEFATGPDGWRRFPDPFGSWHEDPCEDTSAADPAAVHTTDREE